MRGSGEGPLKEKASYILAHDLGTTGNKSCVYRIGEQIELVDSSLVEYPLITTPDGGAEERADDWWNAVCTATRAIIGRTGIHPSSVGGMAFCCQLQGSVMVDGDGTALRNPMIYLDGRATAQMERYLYNGLLKIDKWNAYKTIRSLMITGGLAGTAKDPLWKYHWVRENEPEYAAAIDVYAGVPEETPDGAEEIWLHVQEYQAPADIPEETTRQRLTDLVHAAMDVFALPRARVAVKTRQRGKGGAKYGRFDARGQYLLVREGGARLRVNLFDHLDTGLFLDHRPLRLRLARESRGLRVLNLFCYTASASVHAGLGGAASTTSVDLSPTYLDWAAQNLARNGLSGPSHRLVQADVMAWLEAERARYDLVFCDPPTFSNSARAEDFDLQREHVRLIDACMARLAPGGLLLFSNNFRRFRLDPALAERYAVRDIRAATLDPDFSRSPRIHAAWEILHT